MTDGELVTLAKQIIERARPPQRPDLGYIVIAMNPVTGRWGWASTAPITRELAMLTLQEIITVNAN